MLALASIYKKTVDWSVGGSMSVSTLAIHHQSASLKWSDSKGSSAWNGVNIIRACFGHVPACLLLFPFDSLLFQDTITPHLMEWTWAIIPSLRHIHRENHSGPRGPLTAHAAKVGRSNIETLSTGGNGCFCNCENIVHYLNHTVININI